MALDTAKGTRGGRKMRLGPVGRFVMGGMGKMHRRKGYRFQEMDVLFLTTVGKKSGQERTAPVAWFPDGEDAWIVIASAAGSIANPSWYHNMSANPDRVSIELPGGRKLAVQPEQLDGEARDRIWQQVIAVSPRFIGYQEKTDRQIPVIRLTPA